MYTLGPYQNPDIKQQTIDLLDNLAGNTPIGGGVSIIGVEVTPAMVRTSAAYSIPAQVRSISVSNTGEANGTVLGAVLKPGETVNFAGTGNNYITAFSCDGSGTELLILTIS